MMIEYESELFQIKDYKNKQEMLDAIGSYKAKCMEKYEGQCCFDVKKEGNGLRVIVGPIRGEIEQIRTREDDDGEER